jgi:predicted transcriptional regulator
MACINPDGTLTPAAEKVLSTLDQKPASLTDIGEISGLQLYRVRSNVRELTKIGFVEEKDGKFHITEKGKSKL